MNVQVVGDIMGIAGIAIGSLSRIKMLHPPSAERTGLEGGSGVELGSGHLDYHSSSQ